jgi:hypothetical protein
MGNREVPQREIFGEAKAILEVEGGSWGKDGFRHATEPKAEEARV